MILVLLIMAGITFLMYIGSIGKTGRKLENSVVAKYAAETGIYNMKAELSKLNDLTTTPGTLISRWYNARNNDGTTPVFTSAFGINDPANTSTLRTEANTARISGDIDLKENINDSTSKIVARYKVTIENGDIVAAGKTITGAAQGFDKFGNAIWSNPADTVARNLFTVGSNNYFRYGIRVDGYAVNGAGNNVSGQSVYAVLDVPATGGTIFPSTWAANAPSSFLLATSGLDDLGATVPLNIFSNQFITGPIHSNTKIDFYWRGNFDIFNTSSTERIYNSDINNQFTINTYHPVAGSYDIPIVISRFVHETSQPADVVTVYGRNFSTIASENVIDFGGSGWVAASAAFAPPPGGRNLGLATKLRFTVPPGYPIGAPPYYSISLGISTAVPYTRSQSLGPFVIYTSEMEMNDPGGIPNDDASPKILGIMQVSQPGGIEEVYKQTHRTDTTTNDYRFLDPDIYGDSYPPSVSWDPVGSEPSVASYYIQTLLTDQNYPHRLINVYGKLTYSGSGPGLYYIHSHKAPYTSFLNPYASDHDHKGNILDCWG